MRRSRKPLCVVRRTEGSNPSPSATRTKLPANAHGCAWASQWTTVRRCPCPCGVFTHRGRARGAGTPEALDSVDPPTGGCAGGDLGLTRRRIGGDVAARAERREIIRHSRIRVPQTPQPRARAKAGIRGDRRRQSPAKKPRRPQKRPHHRHPRPDPRTTPRRAPVVVRLGVRTLADNAV
jgi:hypothetical protein